jgi:3-oxoacyl-[acyl-carrier protein] reductase
LNLGLEGRVALVGGGSRGLGRAVAEELTAEGASVAVCARASDSLAATAAELGGLAVPADLAIEGEPTRAVEACVERFGRLEIVVANAGGPPAGGIESFGLEDWHRATALVFTSSVELATAAVPHMRRAGWGRILFITSITARQPVDNLLLSNALRPAVLGFAHSLARELAKEGITVNAILPGYTRTERMDQLGVGAETVAEIPAGRLGEPGEFAAAAAFLVSERASYITGAALPVDGGWLRGMF